MPWHQDNGYTYVEPQAYLTCWIALVDATLDNGCVWVVPGGSTAAARSSTGTPTSASAACPTRPRARCPCPAGRARSSSFSSLTPHGRGPNATDEVRSAYIVQFAPDGAEALRGDPAAPADRVATRSIDARRQYPVLHGRRAGRPAPAAAG